MRHTRRRDKLDCALWKVWSFAVAMSCLMDQPTDQQSGKDYDRSFVVGNRHSTATGRQPNMIDRGNLILASIRHANCERNERRGFDVFSNIANHAASVSAPAFLGKSSRKATLPSRTSLPARRL